MTPREVLDLAGRIAEYEPAERQHRIDMMAEHYRFGTQLDEPVRRGGTALAERVALAAAMLTDPEVLLLNEPLRAVDPEERTTAAGRPRSASDGADHEPLPGQRGRAGEPGRLPA